MKNPLDELRTGIVPGTPPYLLVDPLAGEPVPCRVDGSNVHDAIEARRAVWSRETYTIELPKAEEIPETAYPYLVALTGPDDPWIPETLKIALAERQESQVEGFLGSGRSAHRIGGWLSSALSPQQVATQLGAMMRLRAPAPRRHLRLADRRVLGLLRHVVGDARAAAQLGRIESWFYLDAFGEVASLKSASEDAQTLALTGAEWADLMAGGQLNLVLSRWLGELSRQQAPFPDRRTCYAAVLRSLAAVDTDRVRWPVRMPQPIDRATWAVLKLLHPGIERDARVVTLLDAAADPNETFETIHQLGPTLHAMRSQHEH